MPLIAALFALILIAVPAAAQERISERSQFVSRVGGKSLTRLGVEVTVTPGGGIAGSAFGRSVEGTWDWTGSHFCRAMNWGSRSWSRSCQVVQIDGDRVYFIDDKGRGDSVWLSLP